MSSSLEARLPEDVGDGRIARIRTPQGISLSAWEMRYHRDTPVEGAVGEAKAMFRQIIFSEESAYQYLTPEDIVKIRAKVPEAVKPDLAQETAILSAIFNHVEGVRENPDFGVIANLLKLAALAAESRDQLHEAAYLRTQDSLFGLLFSLVFED